MHIVNAIAPDELRNAVYNDGTVEVINEIDSDKFFHVEKNYQSNKNNDSFVQGCYGIQTYIGGANSSKEIIELLKATQMLYHWGLYVQSYAKKLIMKSFLAGINIWQCLLIVLLIKR